MSKPIALTGLCNWTDGRRVNTRNGPRILRTAVPDETFWQAWRENKEAMRADGISVGKDYLTGDYQVCWWQLPPPEEMEEMKRNIELSQQVSAEIDIPRPDNGMDYYPFQKAAIAFARGKSGILFGDEMGLGKTIEAIGVINERPHISKVLVVCPASLKVNWHRELHRWLVRPLSIATAMPKGFPLLADIVIINYDILSRHLEHIMKIKWHAVIADECHRAKTMTAKRTKALLSTKPSIRMALTGTPILNEIKEIFPILHWLDPEEFPHIRNFERKFTTNGRATDQDAARLQKRLREKFMVRRLKSEVLTELPAKQYQIIEIDAPETVLAVESAALAGAADSEERLIQLEAALELAKVSDNPDEYNNALENLRAGCRIGFESIAKVRHETALAKVPFAIDHINACVESGVKKIVVFAHHRDVIEHLHEALPNSVYHYGGMTEEQKQTAIDRFQNDPNVEEFIGSLKASSEGITLTASSFVIMVEEDWVPATMNQAEDRCHRIGQRDSVMVQHLVFSESIDAQMAHTMVRKMRLINAALDKDRDKLLREPVAPLRSGDKTEHKVTISTRELAERTIDPSAMAAVHIALQILAGVCDGARTRDGQGFNKFDTHIGYRLATMERLNAKQALLGQKLVRKYRKQLEDDLVRKALGNER